MMDPELHDKLCPPGALTRMLKKPYPRPVPGDEMLLAEAIARYEGELHVFDCHPGPCPWCALRALKDVPLEVVEVVGEALDEYSGGA